jgi:hypothetical protein
MQDDLARFFSHPPLLEDEEPFAQEMPSPPRDEAIMSPPRHQRTAARKEKAIMSATSNVKQHHE